MLCPEACDGPAVAAVLSPGDVPRPYSRQTDFFPGARGQRRKPYRKTSGGEKRFGWVCWALGIHNLRYLHDGGCKSRLGIEGLSLNADLDCHRHALRTHFCCCDLAVVIVRQIPQDRSPFYDQARGSRLTVSMRTFRAFPVSSWMPDAGTKGSSCSLKTTASCARCGAKERWVIRSISKRQ